MDSHTWEDTVKRVNELPAFDRRQEIYKLSIVWEGDADIFEFLCISGNQKFNRAEYVKGCQKSLKDAFGFAGVFEEPYVDNLPRITF